MSISKPNWMEPAKGSRLAGCTDWDEFGSTSEMYADVGIALAAKVDQLGTFRNSFAETYS